MASTVEILRMVNALVPKPRMASEGPQSIRWGNHEGNRQGVLDAQTTSTPRNPKNMLTAQAEKLALIFDHLAAEASKAQHPQQTEVLLRLALKVQSQCVNTVRALSDLENPRQVAFVQQANIAQGHQQIINQGSTEPHADRRASTTELLDEHNGKWLDAGAASKTGPRNSTLETVGAVNRPED